MTCYYPLPAWRTPERGASGKRGITFALSKGVPDLPVSIPCGQCIGCRLDRSRQWALRCTFEASLYERNCFITLTFDDDHLPDDNSVNVRDFQLFMKRLKSKVRRSYGSAVADGIRFFACGEYGDRLGRPHYHGILFNFDFDDRILFKVHNDQRYYISAFLADLWPFGHHIIGDVTFESAAYVARYCVKKLTDGSATPVGLNPRTGRWEPRSPEYGHMSRRPGIGAEWFKMFQSDVFPHDYVVHDGIRMAAPGYFDRLFEVDHPELFAKVRAARLKSAWRQRANNTSSRHRVREKVQLARASLLRRGIEDDS